MRRFAVLLLFVLPCLARTENKALLGVVTVEVKKKVVVAHVLPKSPAARAGLEKGDELLSIGRTRIERTDDVDAALKSAAPGDKVGIDYRRGKKKERATASLIERKKYKGDFLKPRRRGETGYEAPPWFAFAWANVAKGKEPPTLENTKGKVVVLHCFQSW